MSEFKGTPGPWNVRSKQIQSVGTDEKMTAMCYGVANANLIAAAPELLEALQLIIKDLRIRAKVRGDIDDDGTVVLDIGSGVLMKANDAIAKALGQ